ncbi:MULTISPECIES: hypothetical protein [unclassified Microcoleus]|nr:MULTISPECIES: hypothetical protein [unclassified Microcoleus]
MGKLLGAWVWALVIGLQLIADDRDRQLASDALPLSRTPCFRAI